MRGTFRRRQRAKLVESFILGVFMVLIGQNPFLFTAFLLFFLNHRTRNEHIEGTLKRLLWRLLFVWSARKWWNNCLTLTLILTLIFTSTIAKTLTLTPTLMLTAMLFLTIELTECGLATLFFKPASIYLSIKKVETFTISLFYFLIHSYQVHQDLTKVFAFLHQVCSSSTWWNKRVHYYSFRVSCWALCHLIAI